MANDDLNSLVANGEFGRIETIANELCAKVDAEKMLAFAISIKIAGKLDTAQKVLEALVRHWPHSASGHYELAEVYRNQKKLPYALAHAEAAASLAPSSFKIVLFYVQMLFANGCWPEGEQVLDRVEPGDADQKLKHDAMREFGIFLQEYPQEKALYISRKLTEKYNWYNAQAVAEKITTAIREKTPFALIRLGDGDGAHFQVNDADEKKYSNFHRLTRKQHTEFLLGVGVDPVFTGYTALTTTLADFVFEADIVGAPYSSWVQHEYEIASPVTINCLMNVNRRLYLSDKVDGLALCDQLIHIQLHDQKLLYPILETIPGATVISCLDGLPTKVSQMFGIKDVDLIKIPSETYAPHLYGQDKLKVSLHYPHAFWPTVQKLSVPHHGRVFLIAAGTFGKYYAAIIKRHGGIALDLGSLVDGWMKMVSRPGYERFAS